MDPVSSLDSIGHCFPTDKVSGLHDFLAFYERRLTHLREEEFQLYEVGVLDGGSVGTWATYFPKATIIGLDVNPDCRRFQDRNIHIRIGDAADPQFLYEVVSEFGRPKVFIDDGSHRWDHQIFTFQVMFPLLIPSGFYMIEDLDTSFQAHLEKAPFQGFSSISAMEYLYRLSRAVVGESALKDEKPYDLFISQWAQWVGSVEFGRRTSVVSKKLARGGGPC